MHFIMWWTSTSRTCDIRNSIPKKSYKGSFNVRLTPELHRRIAISAKMRGESINKFVFEALNQSVS